MIKNGKGTIMWKFNSTFLNNESKKEIKKDINKHLETDKIRNTTYVNVWNAVQVVIIGTFITLNAYSKTKERAQKNHITLNLKELGKDEQLSPKVIRRKHITKMRAEINKIGRKDDKTMS